MHISNFAIKTALLNFVFYHFRLLLFRLFFRAFQWGSNSWYTNCLLLSPQMHFFRRRSFFSNWNFPRLVSLCRMFVEIFFLMNDRYYGFRLLNVMRGSMIISQQKGYQFSYLWLKPLVKAHQFLQPVQSFSSAFSFRIKTQHKQRLRWVLLINFQAIFAIGKTARMHNDTHVDNCWFIIEKETFQDNENLKQSSTWDISGLDSRLKVPSPLAVFFQGTRNKKFKSWRNTNKRNSTKRHLSPCRESH